MQKLQKYFEIEQVSGPGALSGVFTHHGEEDGMCEYKMPGDDEIYILREYQVDCHRGLYETQEIIVS